MYLQKRMSELKIRLTNKNNILYNYLTPFFCNMKLLSLQYPLYLDQKNYLIIKTKNSEKLRNASRTFLSFFFLFFFFCSSFFRDRQQREVKLWVIEEASLCNMVCKSSETLEPEWLGSSMHPPPTSCDCWNYVTSIHLFSF